MYNRIYAEINVDNIRHNILTVKALNKPDIKVLSVIKADAYGHGSVELAKRIGDISDYFGVATIDEAVELRKADIKHPILIIGYTAPDDYDKLIDYNITQTVYNVSDAELLAETAKSKGHNARIHIKVDTGMTRIGFQVTGEDADAVAYISGLDGIYVEGIFTHYAKADEKEKKYAKQQKKEFQTFIDMLQKRGVNPEIKHIDNSAGAMELQDDEFDMIRLGIVMYGLYPSEEIDKSVYIKPAMMLKAHVSHVKTVSAGRGISYGWTFITDRDTRVATITAGYADGYPRAMSNIGRVIINGCYAPILGRVCMDQFMVDVTDIPNVQVKDEVILIGRQGEACVSVEEVAAPAVSFNYELVCNISRRVPRVYVQSGVEDKCVNYLVR
ncbi:MAG: alanine racemase [Lachnospiraceae bacterium]|nr:alanine racemase [Lachnospiraceae bacterium]